MNDRYLFRGKRVDNGEWVIGSLAVPIGFCCTFRITYENLEGFACTQEVIPETIGQCLGSKDKNGKLVFEGDIIKITRGKRQKFGFQPKVQITDIYYGNGAFRYRWEDGSGSVLDFNSVEIVKGYESVTQDVEVIGNIHQNSHLLGGE